MVEREREMEWEILGLQLAEIARQTSGTLGKLRLGGNCVCTNRPICGYNGELIFSRSYWSGCRGRAIVSKVWSRRCTYITYTRGRLIFQVSWRRSVWRRCSYTCALDGISNASVSAILWWGSQSAPLVSLIDYSNVNEKVIMFQFYKYTVKTYSIKKSRTMMIKTLLKVTRI